jgi:predicted RNA-binding Zn-ribbon protein involved in translation (DUF1610 family)
MIEIYRCKDCGLEVGLQPPVTRPCPACGGSFVSASKSSRIADRTLYSPIINRIVNDNFEDLMLELESYLEEQALDA